MPKKSIRQQILARRRSLSFDQWHASSKRAQLQLLHLDEYVNAACIALYASANNETDTVDILEEAFSTGKKVLYPAVCGHRMVFRQVESLGSLSKGSYGILEPCPTGDDFHADEPDLIVVPGVVFDLAGHRIGYGKGYYDRFLQHPGRKAHLVGFCHDFQLIDEAIPAEKHDIRMDLIVTDQRIITCGSNRCHPDGPDSHRGGY
jgi:5-formyltetrahydrofolate cyclo-ligase